MVVCRRGHAGTVAAPWVCVQAGSPPLLRCPAPRRLASHIRPPPPVAGAQRACPTPVHPLPFPMPPQLAQPSPPVADAIRHDQQRQVADLRAVLQHLKAVTNAALGLLLLGRRLGRAAVRAALCRACRRSRSCLGRLGGSARCEDAGVNPRLGAKHDAGHGEHTAHHDAQVEQLVARALWGVQGRWGGVIGCRCSLAKCTPTRHGANRDISTLPPHAQRH